MHSPERLPVAPNTRPITVLFVHLQGYVPLCEYVPPADVVRLLSVYLEEVTEGINLFDGTLLKYMGGQVMALWNAPRLQPDHALLAVRSASDILSRSLSINSQLQEQGLPRIKFGIGVSTGEALAGEIGSSVRKQYDVIGDVVNTAVLLARAAGIEVLLSDATRDLIGDRVTVEETQQLRLDLIGDRVTVEETQQLRLLGKRRQLRIYRVAAE